jgi:hypothetical protein
MYKTFLCRVLVFDGEDKKSMRYGVSAGSNLEVEEAIRRYLRDQGVTEHSILEIREANPSESASLSLSPGRIKLLN